MLLETMGEHPPSSILLLSQIMCTHSLDLTLVSKCFPQHCLELTRKSRILPNSAASHVQENC